MRSAGGSSRCLTIRASTPTTRASQPLAGDTGDYVFDHLRRGVEGFAPFREQARVDTDFDTVRDDPRFEEALS